MTRSGAQLYHQFVGRKALLNVLFYPERKDGSGQDGSPGIQIAVTITDVKVVYGKEKALIVPHHGEGSAWVGVSDKLTVVDEWPWEREQQDEAIEAHDESGIG